MANFPVPRFLLYFALSATRQLWLLGTFGWQIGRTETCSSASFMLRSWYAEGWLLTTSCPQDPGRRWLTLKPSASKDVSSELVFKKSCLRYLEILLIVLNIAIYTHSRKFASLFLKKSLHSTPADKLSDLNPPISFHTHINIQTYRLDERYCAPSISCYKQDSMLQGDTSSLTNTLADKFSNLDPATSHYHTQILLRNTSIRNQTLSDKSNGILKTCFHFLSTACNQFHLACETLECKCLQLKEEDVTSTAKQM